MPLVTDIMEHPHPDAPYRAKGVGEPPTISSTPAIVVAVRPDDIVFGTVARSGWAIVPGADPRGARRA